MRVCVCVEGERGLLSVRQQGAGKPHPYGGGAPQSPFSINFYPQHQPQIPQHLTHTHTQLMYRKIG